MISENLLTSQNKKKCWICGSYTHFKFDYPNIEKNKLLARVVGLERKVSELTITLKDKLKNKT